MVLMSNRLPPCCYIYFDREIRNPFLSAVLRKLHERVEDATMAALFAIDRVVLPVDEMDYPARVIEFKKKSERATRKLAKTSLLIG